MQYLLPWSIVALCKYKMYEFIQFWRPNGKEGPKFSNNIENFLLFMSFRCNINFRVLIYPMKTLKIDIHWIELN